MLRASRALTLKPSHRGNAPVGDDMYHAIKFYHNFSDHEMKTLHLS